jgi:hypothetical protein
MLMIPVHPCERTEQGYENVSMTNLEDWRNPARNSKLTPYSAAPKPLAFTVVMILFVAQLGKSFAAFTAAQMLNFGIVPARPQHSSSKHFRLSQMLE